MIKIAAVGVIRVVDVSASGNSVAPAYVLSKWLHCNKREGRGGHPWVGALGSGGCHPVGAGRGAQFFGVFTVTGNAEFQPSNCS